MGNRLSLPCTFTTRTKEFQSVMPFPSGAAGDAAAQQNKRQKTAQTEQTAPALPTKPPPREAAEDSGISVNLSLAKGASEKAPPAQEFDLTEGQQRRERMADCEFECSEIYSYLFVGGYYVAGNRALLLEMGITHIVNCSASVVENAFSEDPTLRYLSLSMVDGRQDDICWFLPEVVQFIMRARSVNGKILIHCEKGISRSCSYAIAYRIWATGDSWKTCFNFVKKRRKVCAPNTAFTCNLIELGELIGSGGDSAMANLLFRCAYHLPHDPTTATLKLCRTAETRKIITPSTSMLDPLGVFVLRMVPTHEGGKHRLFLWQGSQASDRTMQIATTMAQNLLGIFTSAECVEVLKQGLETVEFLTLLDKEGTQSLFDDYYDFPPSQEQTLLSVSQMEADHTRNNMPQSTRDSSIKGFEEFRLHPLSRESSLPLGDSSLQIVPRQVSRGNSLQKQTSQSQGIERQTSQSRGILRLNLREDCKKDATEVDDHSISTQGRVPLSTVTSSGSEAKVLEGDDRRNSNSSVDSDALESPFPNLQEDAPGKRFSLKVAQGEGAGGAEVTRTVGVAGAGSLAPDSLGDYISPEDSVKEFEQMLRESQAKEAAKAGVAEAGMDVAGAEVDKGHREVAVRHPSLSRGSSKVGMSPPHLPLGPAEDVEGMDVRPSSRDRLFGYNRVQPLVMIGVAASPRPSSRGATATPPTSSRLPPTSARDSRDSKDPERSSPSSARLPPSLLSPRTPGTGSNTSSATNLHAGISPLRILERSPSHEKTPEHVGLTRGPTSVEDLLPLKASCMGGTGASTGAGDTGKRARADSPYSPDPPPSADSGPLSPSQIDTQGVRKKSASGFARVGEVGGSGGKCRAKNLQKPVLFQAVQAGSKKAYEWQALGVYDDDDLQEDGLFLLLTPSEAHFLWVGAEFPLKDLGIDHADASILRWCSTIQTGEVKVADAVGPHLLDKKSVVVVRGGEESDDFWQDFNDGF